MGNNTKIGLQVILAAVVIGFVSLFSSCSLENLLCDNEVFLESPSPDNKHVARAFIRNCGATTSYVTNVEVNWSSTKPTRDNLVFSVTGEHELRMVWRNDLSLVINCQTCTEELVNRQVSKTGPVSIEFEPKVIQTK